VPVADTCVVQKGFNNKSTTVGEQVKCTVANGNLNITSFGYFSSGEFEVKVKATNPSTGNTLTGDFIITTYQDTAAT
jgi:hypothetical protein